MPKAIIGLTGKIASGKEVVKKYLEKKYGATSYKFSGPLRDVLKRLHLPINRENLQDLSLDLRNRFGSDILARVITTDAQEDEHDIVIIDGVRRLDDIKHLHPLPEFLLLSVDADIKTRYERMLLRNENAGDANKTFEQFLEDCNREAEKEIPQAMAAANYQIDNNGDFAALYEQLDKIIAKIIN